MGRHDADIAARLREEGWTEAEAQAFLQPLPPAPPPPGAVARTVLWLLFVLALFWLLVVQSVVMSGPNILRYLGLTALFTGLTAVALRWRGGALVAALAVLGGLVLSGLPLAWGNGHFHDVRELYRHPLVWMAVGGAPLLVIVACLVGSYRWGGRGARRALAVALLAVAVITVAVIFPVFHRARAKAGSPNCLSNVKQLTLALMMYAGDNDDHLPPAPDWPQRLLPYTKNTQLFVCPNDTHPRKYPQPPEAQSYTLSLAANELGLKGVTDQGALGVIFDGTALHGLAETGAFRHNGGANVGYADGHAKWIAQRQFTNALLWPPGLTVAPLRAPEDLPPIATTAPEGKPLSPAESVRRMLKPEQVQALQRVANAPAANAPTEAVAHLKLTAPAEIWTGDTYTLSAAGSYELPPALAQEVLEGRWLVSERYHQGQVFGAPVSGDYQHYTLQARPWDRGGPQVTNTFIYEATLAPVLGGAHAPRTRYLRAEATATSRYRQFRVRLREPTDGPRFRTRAGVAVPFLAAYRLDTEGLQPPPAVQWSWRFGDGGTAEGRSVSHVFSRPGSYWVVGAALCGPRRLEVWLPVSVDPWYGLWPHYPDAKPGPQWSPGYQMAAPGN
jgi:prepilin-type processing-associated H-X9-DG protein